VQFFVFDQLFNCAALNRKTAESGFRFEEEDQVLDDGIPNRVVIFEFHKAFFDEQLWGAAKAPPGPFAAAGRSNQTEAIHLPKTAGRRFAPLCTFQAFSFHPPISYCRVSAV
jgi:hypothetical protein